MEKNLKSRVLKTVEAKVIILIRCVKSNEIMTINKSRRSKLTFDLSAEVTHFGFPSIY